MPAFPTIQAQAISYCQRRCYTGGTGTLYSRYTSIKRRAVPKPSNVITTAFFPSLALSLLQSPAMISQADITSLGDPLHHDRCIWKSSDGKPCRHSVSLAVRQIASLELHLLKDVTDTRAKNARLNNIRTFMLCTLHRNRLRRPGMGRGWTKLLRFVPCCPHPDQDATFDRCTPCYRV
jgi:hypothetical protein